MEPPAYIEFRELEDRHWWFLGRKAIFGEMLRMIAKDLPPRNQCRALDLGCGMGAMLAPLGEVAGFVAGTDISKDSLLHCKTRGHDRTFLSKGDRIPLPDASLDLICAFDTLEHIPEEKETLDECFRLLRPGGFLLLSVPAYQFLYTNQDRVVHHQRRYTRGLLNARLAAAGLQIRKSSYINFLLFPAILPVVLAIKLKEALKPPSRNDYRSNVGIRVPGWANRLLAAVFSFERRILRVLSAPAGHSLIAIGRKPGGTDR